MITGLIIGTFIGAAFGLLVAVLLTIRKDGDE